MKDASGKTRVAPPPLIEIARLAGTAPVGLGLVDPDLTIVWINETLAEIEGVPRESQVSLSVADAVPDIADRLVPVLQSVLETGCPVLDRQLDREPARPGGLPRTYSISYFPINDESGQRLGVGVLVVEVSDQRLAEQQLSHQLQLNQTLLDTTLDGYLLADSEGWLQEVNPAYCKLVGYTREELLRMNIRLLDCEHDEEKLQGRIETLRTAGKDRFETRHRHRDGWLIELDVSMAVLAMGSQPPLVAAFVRDITPAKQAIRHLQRREALFRESEAELRSILGAATDFIMSVDLNGVIRFLNRTTDGRRPEEVIGTHAMGYLPPEGREIFQHAMRVVADTRKPYQYELCARDSGGNLYWFASCMSPVLEKDDVVGFTLCASDITQRKQAERERDSRLRHLQFMDRVNRLIHRGEKLEDLLTEVVDELRCELGCDRGSLAFPGNPEADALQILFESQSSGESLDGKKILLEDKTRQLIGSVIDHEGPLPLVDEQVRELLPAAIVTRFEIHSMLLTAIYPRVGEPWILILKHCKPVTGWPMEDQLLVQDVSRRLGDAITSLLVRDQLQSYAGELERRVASRTTELQEKNSELEAYAHSVSHDLRAPLRAIRGFTAALIEDYGDRITGEGRDYTEQILAASDRMDELIQDLLIFSRLGQDEIRLQPIDLNDAVGEVCQRLDAEIESGGVAVAVMENLPGVQGNRAAVTQVLFNLISNAVKFVAANEQPRVSVRAVRREDRVRLWVEDNGIGIDPAYHARIFKVFERLHGIETYAGTGIGLAIVKRAAHRMGAEVGVESEPDRGSRFWVDFRPASHQPEPE